MAISLADQYYIKALDDYPYNLEEAIENIHYALSYDADHTGALFLMGSFCMEHLQDYPQAESYFLNALAVNPNVMKTNCKYAELLMMIGEYEKSEKLIAYTKTIKGCDLGYLFYIEGFLHEYQQQFEWSVQCFQKAGMHSYNSDFMELTEKCIERVKTKIKQIQPVIWSYNTG